MLEYASSSKATVLWLALESCDIGLSYLGRCTTSISVTGLRGGKGVAHMRVFSFHAWQRASTNSFTSIPPRMKFPWGFALVLSGLSLNYGRDGLPLPDAVF